MGILIVFLICIVALFIGLFANTAFLYATAKYFNVYNLTFWNAFKIPVIAGIVAFIIAIFANIVLNLIGTPYLLLYPVDFVIAYIAFHFFFRKYSQNRWSLSAKIYILTSVASAILALVLVLPIRSFVFKPFLVSGDAMSPTYQTGNYLLINEFDRTYQRGDIVVYKYPKDTSEDFIQRIVGLPGETVTIEQGVVSINGQPLQEPYLATSTPYTDRVRVVLGSDEYFMLGDNRSASNDSRYFGGVPASDIVGKTF